MNNELKKNGFSLTEVLLAVGTFAIGMIFVAGVFPVAIHFTTIATERTIAAVVADEAFAKIRIYGVNPGLLPATGCVDFNDVSGIWPVPIARNEFSYPSTSTNPAGKHYYWSALCRRVDPNNQLVQVTVFVSRKAGTGARYRDRNLDDTLTTVVDPVPVWVKVLATPNPDELLINFVNPVEETFINDGYTIVDDLTGAIYRVRERFADRPDTIELDRNWQGGGLVWVVPPPIGGGRYPCIAIYQKVIRFVLAPLIFGP